MTRAEVYEAGLTPGPDNDLPLLVEQPPSNWRIKLKKPDMSKAIKMLGPTLCEAGRPFLHWKSLAIYPFGPRGTNAQPRMRIAKRLIGDLMDVMPEINQWTLTDTTPVGFNRVFSRKIDTIPVETHQHNDYLEGCYRTLQEYFSSCYEHQPMNFEEMKTQANKQGAAGITDNHQCVKDFLDDPNAEKLIAEVEEALINNQPIHAIWSTMGKLEKKKSPVGSQGSRMVAYLPIATRMVEMKYLGNLVKLTKPDINPAGVGAVGLHDLGERMSRLWKQCGLSDDIAGWDTRVSATMIELEYTFVHNLTKHLNNRTNKIIKRLFQLYKYPHILIPMESDFARSELLEGWGQRLSGSIITYTMNTISRLAVAMTMIGFTFHMTPEEVWVEFLKEGGRFSAMISGDDCCIFSSKEDAYYLSRAYDVLNNMGMVRKDVPLLTPTTIQKKIEAMEFCSHSYQPVTYYDSEQDLRIVRYMPTRSVA